VWLVVVPLMVAGTEVAHALAYRLVYPQAAVRWRALAESGHGYAGWFPVVAGIGGVLMLVGLLNGVVDAARRRPARPVRPWVFGLLPLAGFTLQEFLERWIALGGFPWWMVEQPTFRVGLLLQLPFALVALLVAHLLLRAIERVGVALRERGRLAPASAPARPRPVPVAVPRRSAMATGHAGRGPPPLGCAPLLSRS